LREAHGRSLAPIALAHGGLAILAIRARNAELALHESDLAVGVLDNVKGLYDVRFCVTVWPVLSSEAVLLSNHPRNHACFSRFDRQQLRCPSCWVRRFLSVC
jgi:hypothetical protein